MQFIWDEEKNHSNLLKHGIDFNLASKIFNEPVIIKPDDRMDYGEKRWLALGKLKEGFILVALTIRNGKVRIISARKANRKERSIYNERI